MPRLTIDNRPLELADGERLNCIEAARRVGIEIPHYCWHPGLSVVASCRMCLIEYGTVNRATGQVEMLPKLVPACQTPAVDGSVVVTNSLKVAQARARVEEGLLLDHPIDCPICDKAGECVLQDYHFQYGQESRRADIRPFTSRRRDLGDVALFVDRCVMCGRCVRFVREVSGTSELFVSGRGAHEEIEVLEGFPLANNLSGNVVDLCPVGALADKDFLYKQRVWYLKRHSGVCTGCSTGCSIWIEENHDRIHRLKPRENMAVNRWWICNEGRYGYPHVHDPRRLLLPRRREGDRITTLDWTALPRELNERIRQAVAKTGRAAAVLSPFLTVEEAWLLGRYVRSIDAAAVLALGPVPMVGEDETFPGGFTIRAEKCPNRRGVEAVLAALGGNRRTFGELVDENDRRPFGVLWVSGGHRRPWIDDATARRLAQAETLVVQDLFPSPLSEVAGYALPGAAFAERAGSYVNHAGILQSAERGVRPPAGVRTEASLLWELLGRPGMCRASDVLAEAVQTGLALKGTANERG